MSRTYRAKKGYAWFRDKECLDHSLDIETRISRYDVRLEEAFTPVIRNYEWNGKTYTRKLNSYWCNFRIGSARYTAFDLESWIFLTKLGFVHTKEKYERDTHRRRRRGNRFMKETTTKTRRAEESQLLYRLKKDPEYTGSNPEDHRKYIRGVIELMWD